MNTSKKDTLRPAILEGIEKTDRDFADQLANEVLWARRRQSGVIKPKWHFLGKVILGILLLLNIWILFLLQPFTIQPVLFTGVSGFIMALAVTLFFFRRYKSL
ncbi:hypothetical protein [Chitinophaga qingshengii]|uniref:Uncharacterized protein n=1 Tax=Chitinophaga qingshengii TaxID=1569794 RepID=A0ABR7TQC0_9BACT|nr:hypothetical protein [Chitinophaga qingshengii]MBC9932674.1 hypothetical protein [Chitinophaga qingshengii]